MIAGGIAGLTVDLALYPLDTLKTRLQSSEGFLKAGGFRGVYRGMQSVALGSAPGSAAFFVAYEQSAPYFAQLVGQNNTRQISGKDYSIPATSPIGHMMAAMFGEFTACLIRVPTDQLKMKMQTNQYPSLRTAMASVSSNPSSLYTGFATTLTREIPFSMIQFPLYEALKRKLHDHRFCHAQDNLGYTYQEALNYATVSPVYSSFIGAFVGFVAAALTTPLDVSRTRIMLGRDPYGEKYSKNTISTMKRIYVEGCRLEKALHEETTKQASLKSQNVTSLTADQIKDLVTQREQKTYPQLMPGEINKFYKGGVNSLFRGVVPRTMWISIGGCVYFGAFETAKSFLHKNPIVGSSSTKFTD